jgi:hypothetical protein
LSRNSNVPAALVTPPKPNGCPGKAQKVPHARKNPFWGCPEKVQEIGAVNIGREICCGSKKDPLGAVFIEKNR